MSQTLVTTECGMRAALAAGFGLLLAATALAIEAMPAAAPDTQWEIRVITRMDASRNTEEFKIDLRSDGSGSVYHLWNRGWAASQHEQTAISLSREDTARAYALAAAFVRGFSVAHEWVGPSGEEVLTVGIDMNRGGVACKRERVRSAFHVSPAISEVIQIVNAALPKEKQIH